MFDGWLKVDPESTGDESSLPPTAKGEMLNLVSINDIAKETQPPSRYTEAGLIKELEKRGIGRPSTYASICKTIEDRGYVQKENKSLRPTDTGDVVSSFLEEYFPSYISDSFTAEMEDKLDEIASGKRTYEKTLTEFYGPFHKEVKSKDKLAKATNLGLSDSKFKCPKCGTSPMEIKLGKNGKFLSCTRYPDCDGALTLDGTEFKSDTPIGNDPTTGLPIFVLNGRFGPYVQLGVKPPRKGKRHPTTLKLPPSLKLQGTSRRARKAKVSTTDSIPTVTPNLQEKNSTGSDENMTAPSVEIEKATTPTVTKPKMASIPKGIDPSKVTVADALKYLSLPRNLGIDPKTGKDVIASAGRFGPYIGRDGEFRSVKPPLNVYDITLEQALALLAIPKKPRGFQKKKKE
jgi:DNA topoisomerase-1